MTCAPVDHRRTSAGGACSRLPALGLTGSAPSSRPGRRSGAVPVMRCRHSPRWHPTSRSASRSWSAAESPDALNDAASSLARAGGRLSFLGMKDFADGSLGAHTAAMRRPFADCPPSRARSASMIGPSRWHASALDLGGSVAIHAIGDRAVEPGARPVRGVARWRSRSGPAPHGTRLDHPSRGHPAVRRAGGDRFDTAGFPSLGNRLAGTPTRPRPDALDLCLRLAGRRRCPAGGRVGLPQWRPRSRCAGWPPPATAPGSSPRKHWSADAALALFTEGASRASGLPPPLQPGCPADMVVLDSDPVETESLLVEQIGVRATYMDGVEVWRHPDHRVTERSGPPSPPQR